MIAHLTKKLMEALPTTTVMQHNKDIHLMEVMRKVMAALLMEMVAMKRDMAALPIITVMIKIM